MSAGFVFGARSRAALKGVHPKLIAVVERALDLTTQDFSVHDGVRSLARQQALVRSGASQTLRSKHRLQADGYGHAVDLVPWIDGQMRWEWPAIHPIAAAMWRASEALGVPIIWGGAWIRLDAIGDGGPEAMAAAVDAYGARQRAAGRAVFTDGPHYELAS